MLLHNKYVNKPYSLWKSQNAQTNCFLILSYIICLRWRMLGVHAWINACYVNNPSHVATIGLYNFHEFQRLSWSNIYFSFFFVPHYITFYAFHWTNSRVKWVIFSYYVIIVCTKLACCARIVYMLYQSNLHKIER